MPELPTATRVPILRVNNPGATLQEIADLCHITRERVRQILQDEDLPTCSTGEMARRMGAGAGAKACKTCGKRLYHDNKTGYCQKHLRDGITHCPSGHLYNEENTHINKKGDRICRVCRKERMRQWQQAHPTYWKDRAKLAK